MISWLQIRSHFRTKPSTKLQQTLIFTKSLQINHESTQIRIQIRIWIPKHTPKHEYKSLHHTFKQNHQPNAVFTKQLEINHQSTQTQTEQKRIFAKINTWNHHLLQSIIKGTEHIGSSGSLASKSRNLVLPRIVIILINLNLQAKPNKTASFFRFSTSKP